MNTIALQHDNYTNDFTLAHRTLCSLLCAQSECALKLHSFALLQCIFIYSMSICILVEYTIHSTQAYIAFRFDVSIAHCLLAHQLDSQSHKSTENMNFNTRLKRKSKRVSECVCVCVWFSAHLIISIYAIREQIVYDVFIFNYMLLDYSNVSSLYYTVHRHMCVCIGCDHFNIWNSLNVL